MNGAHTPGLPCSWEHRPIIVKRRQSSLIGAGPHLNDHSDTLPHATRGRACARPHPLRARPGSTRATGELSGRKGTVHTLVRHTGACRCPIPCQPLAAEDVQHWPPLQRSADHGLAPAVCNGAERLQRQVPLTPHTLPQVTIRCQPVPIATWSLPLLQLRQCIRVLLLNGARHSISSRQRLAFTRITAPPAPPGLGDGSSAGTVCLRAGLMEVAASTQLTSSDQRGESQSISRTEYTNK